MWMKFPTEPCALYGLEEAKDADSFEAGLDRRQASSLKCGTESQLRTNGDRHRDVASTQGPENTSPSTAMFVLRKLGAATFNRH